MRWSLWTPAPRNSIVTMWLRLGLGSAFCKHIYSSIDQSWMSSGATNYFIVNHIISAQVCEGVPDA